MARPPGRDQTAPMERLVRLIGALNAAPGGAPLAVLLTAVSPGDSDDAARKMLQRDVEHLNALGYNVRNVAEAGSDGVYLMRAHDNRLRVHLDAEQRGELLRAAMAAGLDDMAGHLDDTDLRRPPRPRPTDSADLDLVQRATARHCLVRFVYKGEPRVVHPARVHSGPSGWYLTGREADDVTVKEFVVSRMSSVSLEAPGSAEVLADPVRRSLDPLSWEVDTPTAVVLAVPAEHRVIAENLLGTPVQVTVTPAGGDRSTEELALTYVVTHRQVFRYRLYELGTRVRVVSPDDVRAELVAELSGFLTSAP